MLLSGVLLGGCSGGGSGSSARVVVSAGPVDRLNTAVRAVAADRTALLGSLDAVQRAATALDAADAACATGDGIAARRVHRAAEPLVGPAAAAVRDLPGRLATYRGALRSLGAASVAVTGATRQALLRVVTTGQDEAAAVQRFGEVAAGVWPRYAALDADETTWITRAVTPWYRSQREGADAYVVLVEDGRPALDAARRQLGAAVTAVHGPIASQAAVLGAADAALAAARAAG